MYTIESKSAFGVCNWVVACDGEYLFTCATYEEARVAVNFLNEIEGN